MFLKTQKNGSATMFPQQCFLVCGSLKVIPVAFSQLIRSKTETNHDLLGCVLLPLTPYLHVFALSSDWFVALFPSVVISCSRTVIFNDFFPII